MPGPSYHGWTHAPNGTDPAPGVGIEFHNATSYGDNNAGDQLDVFTDDYQHFNATGDFTAESSGDGDVNLLANGNGKVSVKANGDGGLEIKSTGDGELKIHQTGDADLSIEQSGEANLNVINHASGGKLVMGFLGTAFQVKYGTTVVLEIRDDLTFHILSGATWIADL